MESNFAHLWQQEELSDASIVISRQGEEEGADPVILQKLPGHTVLLSTSPFFKAMILRWQHKRARTAAQRGRELVLTLQDAEQLPAAMSVLAALYAVKALPELLAELSDVQQLQATLLADMWQVPKVSTAAVQHLVDAANKAAPSPPDRVGLSDAVVHALLDLAAFPPCVLSLLKLAAASCRTAEQKAKLKRVLLLLFGDLQAVWADAALSKVLLDLPMPAMQLLLASDELQACEDNVLYTAQAYLDAESQYYMYSQQSFLSRREQLSVLIRCPHLSGFWLTAAALASDADRPKMLLGALQPRLKQLLLAQQVAPGCQLSASAIQTEVPGAPRVGRCRHVPASRGAAKCRCNGRSVCLRSRGSCRNPGATAKCGCSPQCLHQLAVSAGLCCSRLGRGTQQGPPSLGRGTQEGPPCSACMRHRSTFLSA